MKAAEIAAVSLIVAHRMINKIGLKIIPPPIPIKPETKPNNDPMPIAGKKGIGFKTKSAGLKKFLCKIFAMANNKQMPRMIL